MDDDIDDPFVGHDSENEDNGEEKKSEKVTNADESSVVPVPVRKRITRNPRLKFNAERLCGDRGIPVLVDHFKDVKFKGKGHEKEDLDKLLGTLEHWTHRLFPSMKFMDCLRQIEKLGKKRPVQTCLRKIRLDMPILSGDFVGGDDEERDKESVQSPEPEAEHIDPFDTLISQNHQEETVQQVLATPPPNQSVGHVLGSTFGGNLTDEQRKRMEYNRMLAAERRKAKLSAVQQNLNLALNDSMNLSESRKDESSLNETSSPTELAHLSSDIFQSSSSTFLAAESESLLQSNDKNHSSIYQNVQELPDAPIDQNVIANSSLDDNLMPENIFAPSSKKLCVDSQNNGLGIDVQEFPDAPIDQNVIANSSLDDNLMPENIFAPSKKLCVDSQKDGLGIESYDSSALSQSILDVNVDFNSNAEDAEKNCKEISSSSEGVVDMKENSDELKMDELMNLIDE